MRQHLVAAFGARRIRELSADDVARFRFLQDKAAAGYSRATLDKLRGVLVQALRHAERQGLVSATSPASCRPRRPAGTWRFAHRRASQDLLAAAGGHPLEAAIMVGLTCGLRPGELLALAWDDVDLDAPAGCGCSGRSSGSAARSRSERRRRPPPDGSCGCPRRQPERWTSTAAGRPSSGPR